jgi:solute carrier family 35 protein F1/2
MSIIHSGFPENIDDKKSETEESVPQLPNDQFVVRPPIDYSSFDAFFHSIWCRFLSLWTRRFVLSLLAGQLVSLCITCTNVTTQELTTGNWQLPTTQTFFLCAVFVSSRTQAPILTGL